MRWSWVIGKRDRLYRIDLGPEKVVRWFSVVAKGQMSSYPKL